MIREVRITNIRGIREGVVNGLTLVSVLVGPNNSGKSAVLDSILIGASPNPMDALHKATARRQGLDHGDRWFVFQERGVVAKEARISISADNSDTRITQLIYKKGPQQDGIDQSWTYGKELAQMKAAHGPEFFPRTPVGAAIPGIPEVRIVDTTSESRLMPLHDLYSAVSQRGLSGEAKLIVKELVPDITDFEILTIENNPVMCAVFKSGSRPLALNGDGIRLLFRIAFELAAPAGGVVLLEEPEAHMHPGAIHQLAKAILFAAARGIQVILTTHSLDLIDSFLAQSAPDGLDNLSIHRLALDDGHLRTSNFSGKDAAFARTQIEDNLR